MPSLNVYVATCKRVCLLAMYLTESGELRIRSNLNDSIIVVSYSYIAFYCMYVLIAIVTV